MPNRSVSYQAAPVHLMLDQRFYRRVTAATFPDHLLRFRNDRVAASVGLDGLDDQAWIDHFGKFNALPDNIETRWLSAITATNSAITIQSLRWSWGISLCADA